MIRDYIYISWINSVSLVLTQFNSSKQASTRDSVYNCFRRCRVCNVYALAPALNNYCASFGSVFSGTPFECYGEICAEAYHLDEVICSM